MRSKDHHHAVSLFVGVFCLLSLSGWRAGAEPAPLSYTSYFTAKELRDGHPRTGGPLYHNAAHTVNTMEVAYNFALARGLSPKKAQFVAEVALLHDWDSARTQGTPARVSATLDALRKDFYKVKPLILKNKAMDKGKSMKSVLRERFGWTQGQLNMALAMIQRTEYPFSNSYDPKKSKQHSPFRRYAQMVGRLPAKDRAFVLREGALLSEYADKGSWYFKKNFKGAFKVVEGLKNEFRTIPGKGKTTISDLETGTFLRSIGTKSCFTLDAVLAQKLGVPRFEVPHTRAFFKLVPQYEKTFKATRSGFQAFQRQLLRGKSFENAVVKGMKSARHHRLRK